MKIGIIGCGNIAQIHAKTIKTTIPQAQLIFCDRNVEKVDRLKKMCGGDSGYTSIDDLFSAGQPDAVHILTQPNSHAPIAEQALSAGTHVYVEKPITERAADYIRLTKLARSDGKLFCAGYSALGMPVIQEAKRIVGSHQYGALVTVHCDFNFATHANAIPYGRPDHWAYSLPGGILQNVVDHPASLVIDAMDTVEDHRMMVGRRRQLPMDSPDLIHIALTNETQLGSLTVSFGHGNASAQVYYFLEGATIMVDVRRQLLTVAVGRGPQGIRQNSLTGLKIGWSYGSGSIRSLVQKVTGSKPQDPGIAALITNFYAAIDGKEQLIVEEATSLQVITVLEAVWKELDNQKRSGEG